MLCLNGMKKIAIFASGGGSNFKAIYEKIISGDIPAEITIVVSNNPNCGTINFAKKNALSTLIVNKTRYPDPYSLNMLLKQNLLKADVDLICLAGYMKIIPQNIVAHFKNCILNIHPSLLPNFGGKGFYGMKVHDAVIQSNAVESGATVHFVDNNSIPCCVKNCPNSTIPSLSHTLSNARLIFIRLLFVPFFKLR